MIFGMNMMRPANRRTVGGIPPFFMRGWEYFPLVDDKVTNFTGMFDGKNGSINWDTSNATVHALQSSGNNIWQELFLGFSFANENPGLTNPVSTFNNAGWYVYEKIEWWPSSSTEYADPNSPITLASIRTHMSYEHLMPPGYHDWYKYGVLMNFANWVAIGSSSQIFATGKII